MMGMMGMMWMMGMMGMMGMLGVMGMMEIMGMVGMMGMMGMMGMFGDDGGNTYYEDYGNVTSKFSVARTAFLSCQKGLLMLLWLWPLKLERSYLKHNQQHPTPPPTMWLHMAPLWGTLYVPL